MAVSFGADALAGVINIITKKESAERLSANVTVHEETVEKQYSWLSEGIHNWGVIVNGKPSERIFVQGEAQLNRFGGWIGDPKDFSDRNRQWYPKEQQLASGLIRYTGDDFSVYYRLDQLSETITNLGGASPSDSKKEPFASDEEYLTKRYTHQLQGETEVGKWMVTPVLSFARYARSTETFTTFLTSGLETNRRERQIVRYENSFMRTTAVHNAMSWGSVQAGAEVSYDVASGTTLNAGDKATLDLAGFTA